MQYEEIAPSAAFSPFIERFWRFETDDSDPHSYEHVVVPDGTANLALIEILAWPPASFFSLSGACSQALRVPIERGVRYSGARLRTGAVRAFLGLEPAALTDLQQPLGTLLPELAATLTAACMAKATLADFAAAFEAVTQDRTRHTDELDSVVCTMAQRMIACDGFTPLDEIMADFPLGERQLRRRFLCETGLSPKVYSRLRRVRRACVDLAFGGSAGVAAVSAEHGYADQPHFTRELKAVFGMSPRQLRDYLQQIRHFNVQELSEKKL